MYGRLRQAQGDITTDVRRVPGFDGLSKSVMHTVLRSGKVDLRADRRRYEDIIKMGSEGVDCIHLAQDRMQWRTLLITSMKMLIP